MRPFLCLLFLPPPSGANGAGRSFIPVAFVAGEGQGEVDFLVAVVGVLFALAGEVAIGKESFLFVHLFVKNIVQSKFAIINKVLHLILAIVFDQQFVPLQH